MSQQLARFCRLNWLPTNLIGWLIAFLTVCVAIPTAARFLSLEVGPLAWVIGRHVAVPGLPLTFLAVHPAAPLTPRHTKWTEDQPRLRSALNSVPGPVLVAGDFNATLDHAIMRELQQDGFTDAAEATGSGVNATWPQGYRVPFPCVSIDHVMHRSVNITAVKVETAIVPQADHRAVIATYMRATQN